jgi:serine/threonine protein kinase
MALGSDDKLGARAESLTRLGAGGRFELLAQIGEGGMGVVHEALDREHNVLVALKTLPRLKPDSLLRFKNEFRALQGIQHANLVGLRELFEDRGRWFFTMDLVQGRDFLSYVRKERESGGPPVSRAGSRPSDPTRADASRSRSRPGREREVSEPPLEAARTSTAGIAFDEARLRRGLAQLAEGLLAIHAVNKVHRDIKPSNVLVTLEEIVKILDFGLVAERGAGDLLVVGTPAYMAPEQASGIRVGPEADWYSVGVMLYAALTGEPPFTGSTELVLQTKLTVDPAPPSSHFPSVPTDLADIAMELLQRDPARRLTGTALLRRLGRAAPISSAPPGSRRSDLAPRPEAIFVGREKELARFETAWQDAQHGQVTICVEGESGVGKSALVAHFTNRLAALDVRTLTLRGTCYERESVPFKAIDGIIDSLAAHLSSMPDEEVMAILPADISLLAHAFPVLRAVPRIESITPFSVSSNPAALRNRLFDAVRDLLIRLSRVRRLMVVIDDLQWSDADSLVLLRRVLHPPSAPPFLLLATMRAGAQILSTEGRPLDVSLPGDVRTFELGGLPPEAARKLASRLLHDSSGEADTDAIASEARGHPLFIGELVRYAYKARARGGVEIRLEEVLAGRVRTLDGPTLRVLELVSLAGEPLPLPAVADAAGMDMGELAERATVLRNAHLARTSGVRTIDRIEPYHDRVRAVVRSGLSREARSRHHLRLAQALAAMGGVEPETLAVHFREAGQTAQALEYTLLAADRATSLFAFNRAAELYRDAASLVRDTDATFVTIRAKLGDALTYAGRSIEAAESYLVAARALGDTPEGVELHRRAAQQLLFAGSFGRGMDEMKNVLAVVGLSVPDSGFGAVASLLFRRLRVRLRGLSYQVRKEEEIPRPDLLKIDTCWAAVIGLGLLDVVRAGDYQSLHLLLCLKAGDPARVCRALSAEVALSAADGTRAAGRTQKLVAALEEQVKISGNTPAARGFAAGTLAVVAQLEGRFKDVIPLFEQAEALIGHEWSESTRWELDSARVLGYGARSWLGHIRETLRRVPVFLDEGIARNSVYVTTHMRSGIHVLAWLAQGDADAAAARLDAAMADWPDDRICVPHVLDAFARIHLHLYTGEYARAYEHIHLRWPAMARSFLLRCQYLRVQLVAVRARAALAVASRLGEGKRSERERFLREASRDASSLVGEGAPWSVAQGMLVRAGVQHVRGRDDLAHADLVAAAASFTEMEMQLFAAATNMTLGELVGGDEGRAMRVKARAHFEKEGIVDRPRMTAILVPGFEKP